MKTRVPGQLESGRGVDLAGSARAHRASARTPRAAHPAGRGSRRRGRRPPGSASPRAGGSADPSFRSRGGVSQTRAAACRLYPSVSVAAPTGAAPADQIRGLLGDHHRRRVRVRARDRRHDGRVDDPQPLDPVDAQLGVDHRADRARRGRVVDRLAVRADPGQDVLVGVGGGDAERAALDRRERRLRLRCRARSGRPRSRSRGPRRSSRSCTAHAASTPPSGCAASPCRATWA